MRVIVFDLDDTLASERDFVLSGIRAVGEDLREIFSEEFVSEAVAVMSQAVRSRRNHYSALEKLADQWLAEGKIKCCPDMKRIVTRCRNHIPDGGYGFRPGIEGTLLSFSGRGDVVGLITDGRSVTQRRKIEALALGRWISDENIFISEERGYDKRRPEPFRSFMERYPTAEEYVYIGDNPMKDFEVANRLGWTTVMLRDTSGINIHPQSLLLHPSLMPKIIL